MKHLEPLRTYLSPLRTAVVRMPETSEPASGSVRQKEASLKSSVSIPRYCFLSSSRAGQRERRRGQAVGAERRRDARAAPGELLLDDASVEVGRARPAVLLGHVRVHQAELPGLAQHVVRPRAVLVVLPGDGTDLLRREVVRHLAQRLLLVGQREIDHVVGSSIRARLTGQSMLAGDGTPFSRRIAHTTSAIEPISTSAGHDRQRVLVREEHRAPRRHRPASAVVATWAQS